MNLPVIARADRFYLYTEPNLHTTPVPCVGMVQYARYEVVRSVKQTLEKILVHGFKSLNQSYKENNRNQNYCEISQHLGANFTNSSVLLMQCTLSTKAREEWESIEENEPPVLSTLLAVFYFLPSSAHLPFKIAINEEITFDR